MNRTERLRTVAALLGTSVGAVQADADDGWWWLLADNPPCTPWCGQPHRDLELAVFESFECRRLIDAGDGWSVTVSAVRLPESGPGPRWQPDSGAMTIEVADCQQALSLAAGEVEPLRTALAEARALVEAHS